MRFDRKSPLTACFQCLNCYKTYKAKGPSKEEQDVAEQKALDCCGSFIQGFYVNYRRWGIQKWYGRETPYPVTEIPSGIFTLFCHLLVSLVSRSGVPC